ncbi:Protein FAR1-RELATED SEQUENCE 5 [Hordeum vulgare]|nr:Protein FAR1-RELATED SEQUENCE 5 [Hordeum vulgare]
MYRVASADQGSNVGVSLNDIAKAYEKKACEQNNRDHISPRQEQRLQQIGYTGDNLKMMRQGPFKGSSLTFSMRGPSRGSSTAFRIVNEISNARRMSPRCVEECRHEERKYFTGRTTYESNNCKIPLPTLKGKQPAQKQVVYMHGYCNNKNVEVEAVQVLGFTGTRETENNSIREDDRREGGNNVREVVMDCTSSSDGAPAPDKQARCNSSVRNELIPGHERDDISSDNDDDPNGDTLDNIDIGKATQEEKEMDEMFKGSAFPSIEEVTQAREPEDGLHFKNKGRCLLFLLHICQKGVDNHGSSVLFGIGLLKDETIGSFKWLLSTFVEAMGGKEPKFKITHQDKVMKAAIEQALPSTRNRFCLWHIRKNMKENNATVFVQHPRMSDELHLITKSSLNTDEFEGSWKRAISKYNVDGNRHLNALWELRTFRVPAYFKDCFYPFSSTTTHSKSTNSMWKNYVNHKDNITMFVGAYNIIQQNCLATLDKKRHQTEEKLELRNRTYYKCYDLAKGTIATFFPNSSVDHPTSLAKKPGMMWKRNVAARDSDGGPSSPNRRRMANEDHARYLWENNLPVPWPSVVLPEWWNLNDSRVPIPQVPVDGLEHRRKIRRRGIILPLDLKLDPGFAPTSDL